MRHILYAILLILTTVGCSEQKKPELTPWGTVMGEDTMAVDNRISLDEIVGNGEMIVLTMSGPGTYYDYHGRAMGLQYMLCEKFANELGVSLRVEICKDTMEMVRKLKDGEGDIIALQLPSTVKGVRFSGAKDDTRHTQWAVRADNTELADTLDRWFKPTMIAQMRQEEDFLLSTRSVVRHVYAPMLNRSGGVISHYDHYFQQYAPLARWDWRLMAAQCYQESTFDPNAHSWAGARGLMQIMPGTAAHLGLPQADLTNPERNIAAAAKYIAELSSHFSDIPSYAERQYFVLASYNGGARHVRDAMALARKYGKNPQRWGDVSEFVLKLSQPQYYNDPVAKYGYMRGSETVDYVERIRRRYAEYRGVAKGGFGGFSTQVPHKARHKYRFKV